MIIRHSLKLLEQLTEIEAVIQKIEKMMDDNGIEGDRDQLLSKILKGQEAKSATRPMRKLD